MTVDFHNTPIKLDVYGHGSPLILIHGFLEERKIWDDFIPMLKEKCQVIRPDLFGHGETPRHREDIQTMEEMADAIALIMDKLGVEKAKFIGHSMGGYITMAFAEKYPDRIEKLMLLDSSPQEDSEVRLKEREQVLKIVPKHKKIFVRSAVSNLFAEESRIRFKEKLEERINEAMKMEVESIVVAVKGMRDRKDREEVLKNFPREKWIVSGEEDSLIPIDIIEQVAKNTGATFVRLPGGHMSYIEQEEKVREIFRKFIS